MDKNRITKEQLIKELSHAQKRIKELEKEKNEDFYRYLIEHSLQGIVILQGNRIVYANQTVTNITGLSIEELLSLSPEQVRDLIHPEDQANVFDRMRERLSGKDVLDRYIIRVLHKDEGYKWLQIYSRRIEFKGEPAIQAAMINISDRKEAEHALFEMEEMYHAVTTTSPDAVTMTDLQGIIKYASRQTYKLHRVKRPEDMIGRNTLDFVAPEEHEKALKNIEKVAQGKTIRELEYTMLRDDGSKFPGSLNASMIKDDQGNPTGFIAITRDITEQKKAENELKKREATLNSIFRVAPTGIGLVVDSVFLQVNDRICDMIGYSKEEILGKNARFLYPSGKEYQSVGDELYKQIKEKGTGTVESRWLCKNGKSIDVLLSSTPLDPNELSAGVTFTAQDISERKRMIEELKNSEDRLKILFEYAPDAYYLNDLKGRFLDGNKAAEALIGYSKEELIGKSFIKLNLIDKTQIKKAAILLSRNARGKATGPDEFILTRKDGSQVILEIQTYPVKINNRIQVLGMARDVTEQHKTIDALRKSEEKFRNLAEKSPNMIFINKRGRVIYSNKRCSEVTGYSLDEFLSPDFNFFKLIAPESMERIKKIFNRHLRGEEVLPYEYSLVTKEGKRIDAIVTTKLIPYEDDTAILGIVTDITERKKIEEKIKASLKEKEVMLREIHHRVKNNMQIITSLLRLQATQIKDEKIQKMFKLSQNRIKSMSLIHESLYQSQDLSQINFTDYIQKITTHLISLYHQKDDPVNIKYNLKDVHLDINKAIPFGLIINELITNALKHAFPSGVMGEIELKLRQEKSGKVIFYVKDNGTGIPGDVNIEKPETLGLQLVYDLTRQLNGSVEFNLEKGTIVKVVF